MKTITLLIAVTAFTLTLTPSVAATLSNLTSGGTSISNVNLSTEGTTNWAAWDVRVDPGSASIAATQFKGTGTGTISSITPFGGTAVRGSDSFSNYTDTFTWTQSDEDSNTAAPSDGLLSGIFNTSLDAVGLGVTFNITDLATLTGGQYYEVNVYTSTFRGRGEFNANINGGTSITQSGPAHTTFKDTDYFSIAYNPDNISDTLNISFELSVDASDSSSHVAIQAVAISVVPEPGTYALIAGCFAFLWITCTQRRQSRQ